MDGYYYYIQYRPSFTLRLRLRLLYLAIFLWVGAPCPFPAVGATLVGPGLHPRYTSALRVEAVGGPIYFLALIMVTICVSVIIGNANLLLLLCAIRISRPPDSSWILHQLHAPLQRILNI